MIVGIRPLVLPDSFYKSLIFLSFLKIRIEGKILRKDNVMTSPISFTVYGEFLIDGPNCKIPNLNPFAKEAMKVFKRESFEACSPIRPLTSVETFDDGRAKLRIHKDRKKNYLSWWQSDLKVREKMSSYNNCQLKIFLSPAVLLPANHSSRL